MNKCSFERLCEKDVINSCDCSRLGTVADLIIDLECGKVISIIVCDNNKLFISSKKNDCLNIPFERICKIGEDIILVDIPPIQKAQCSKEIQKKKFF